MRIRNDYHRARGLLDEHMDLIRSTPTDLDAWSSTLATIFADLMRDPLLSACIASARDVEPHWEAASAPVEAQDWGPRAFVTGFLALRDGPPTASTFYFALKRSESTDVRTRATWVYVIPMLRWLRREIERGGSLEVALEDWTQRVRWFGAASVDAAAGASHGEDAYQRDLAIYLFDRGIPPWNQGRELRTATGFADFLLRTGEPAAVEVKVWRDEQSVAALRLWTKQALRYPQELGIGRCYLIVASLDPARALQVAPSLEAPNSLSRGGIEFHVRVVDLCSVAPSKDRRRSLIVDETLLFDDT